MDREERRKWLREWRASGISTVLIWVLLVLTFWWLREHPDWGAAVFHRNLDGTPRVD